MTKLPKLAMIAGMLSLISTGVLADSGLSICSSSTVTDQIHVACGPTGAKNPSDTPFPVPAGGCINSGKALPWFPIAGFLQGNKGQCIFYIKDKAHPIAIANVSVQFSTGNVSLATTPVDYTIDFGGYTPGTDAASIKVTIAKK